MSETRPPSMLNVRNVLSFRDRATVAWLGVLILLCGWTAWKLGAFDLTVPVSVGGRVIDMPNLFATVDHPFHATRAYTLLESLKDGHLLRWVGNHQGGYPIEFYPLGVAWLDVGIWALLLGTVPVLAVHKLAVILIFLMPAIGFWMLARADRISPGVAVLATAMHIAIPGGNGYVSWATGGYTELVQWGLVTNVAGATAAMVATAMLIRFVAEGQRSLAVWAILFAAGAAYANPRSLFAIVIAAVAIFIAGMLPGQEVTSARLRLIAVRIAAVGALALLLAMPIFLPLVRYGDLYYFVHYESYATVKEYWTASVHAVSPPAVYLCLLGIVITFAVPRHVAARATSLTLLGYIGFTAWLSVGSVGIDLIQQLEPPRLMPYQRLLVIYLAAFGLGKIAEVVVRRIAPERFVLVGQSGLLVVAALAVLIVFIAPVSGLPEVYRGLQPVAMTGTAPFADYDLAVDEASARLPEGTSILAIGTTPGAMEWHAQLFGPSRSDAPFFYNDWLWYWHDLHDGTPGYNPLNGHSYPDPANALDPAYLSAQGVGAVVVTDVATQQLQPGIENPDPRLAARSNPALSFVATYGDWDVYLVANAVPVLTDGNQHPTAVSIDNQRITSTFADGSGDILIRQNWYPRWTATVNGDKVPIQRAESGYMRIQAPAGKIDLVLSYSVTGLDWFSRVCALAGGVLVLLLTIGRALPGRDPWRWLLSERPDAEESAA